MSLDADALRTLDAFDEELERLNTALSATAKGILERLFPMTIKLALLGAVGRPGIIASSTVTISNADATAAIQIARRWREDAVRFATQIGETDFERRLQVCARFAETHGAPVNRNVVARNCHMDKRTLDAIQETLMDREVITVTAVPQDRKGGHQRVEWRWKG